MSNLLGNPNFMVLITFDNHSYPHSLRYRRIIPLIYLYLTGYPGRIPGDSRDVANYIVQGGNFDIPGMSPDIS